MRRDEDELVAMRVRVRGGGVGGGTLRASDSNKKRLLFDIIQWTLNSGERERGGREWRGGGGGVGAGEGSDQFQSEFPPKQTLPSPTPNPPSPKPTTTRGYLTLYQLLLSNKQHPPVGKPTQPPDWLMEFFRFCSGESADAEWRLDRVSPLQHSAGPISFRGCCLLFIHRVDFQLPTAIWEQMSHNALL